METVGVKWPGLKDTNFKLSDTLVDRLPFVKKLWSDFFLILANIVDAMFFVSSVAMRCGQKCAKMFLSFKG